MKKLNLFLLVAGFFVFSSCTERLENNEEKSSGNVVINLSSVNAERGAVPDGYSSVDISEVEKWTLTFSLVPPFDKFPAETRTITRDSNSVTIGVGEYDLFVEGSYTVQGVPYNLSGACSGIVVEEGNKKTVSVLVGPKKTTEGKGSFSAEMSFMQGKLYKYYYETIGLSENTSTTDEKSKRFKAELVSRKTGETVYSTHSGEKLLVAVADTGDSSVTVKSAQTESEPNKISSGYYYFYFYADFAPVKLNDPSAEITPDWKEVSIGDNLVEIGDGLSTSWPPLSSSNSKSLSFPDESTKYCYYASDKGSKENNGISLNARGELYAVLDTIYNNPMVQNAVIDYTYTDSIRFDVSKIRSGKTVEIICNKKDPQAGDTPRFTLNKDSSVLFNMYAESITLFSTGGAKGVKIKEESRGSQFSLEDGVYLDLTSLTTAEELSSLSLGFWLDDNNVDYYKNNPMMVSSVSLGTVQGAFAFYIDYSQFPSETYSYNKDNLFAYNMKEVPGTGMYNYFAEEPEFGGVVYYSNDSSIASYKIELKNSNGVYNMTALDDSAALASWCDDGKNGFYVFEIRDIQNVGQYNQKHLPDNPVYNVRHFEKIKKGTSFIFNQTKIDCNIKNIPVSMCTDGTNIYYVQSMADISGYGGKSFELYNWGHWAYRDNKVKYFSVEDPSVQNELDFSNVFTDDGKVTAVYYYDNKLYVAGYKKEYIGSVFEGQEQAAQEIKFYNCTYSVYKLSNPKGVTTAKLVSNVFNSSEEKDRVADILKNYSITDSDRIKAYSAITDMAIVDGNLYVLENSYYKITPTTYGYGCRGSLRQVSLENGKVLKVLDENSNKEKVGLPYKIIAVLPKKLKISDNKKKDAGQGQNVTYDVDLSASDLSMEEKGSASGYHFDNYGAAGSGLIESETFKTEGIYTEPSENDKKNNAFTSN